MDEATYWEERYQKGRGSNRRENFPGFRQAFWEVMDRECPVQGKRVLDVGCGDLSLWKTNEYSGHRLQLPHQYWGMDISPRVVTDNTHRQMEGAFHRHSSRPARFLCHDAVWADPLEDSLYSPFGMEIIQPQVVMAISVLIHVMTEDRLRLILTNLRDWTRETLVVSSWCTEPDHLPPDSDYQRFWHPQLIEEIVGSKAECHHIPVDNWNMLYVFRR